MTYLPFLLACSAADLAAGYFDARQTVIGLKIGSGVEADTIINFLSGSLATQRPSAVAIVIYNVVRTALFTALAFTGNYVLIGGAFGGLTVGVIQHIQSGMKWRFLNRGGKIDRSKMYSAWEKFLGMGWY